MVVTVIVINMSGNWIASKLDWLMTAYAMASASFLLAASHRQPVAKLTSPPPPLPATPASVYVNNRRQVGGASSATNAHQQRNLA
jgi:hypothetical protein